MGASQSVEGANNHGWLVTSIGCCAPTNNRNSEDEEELKRESSERDVTICYEQPQTVEPLRNPPPSTRPITSHSMAHFSHWMENGLDFASRASTRISMSSSRRPWTSHSRASHSRGRPSIGAPMDFRKVEEIPRRRRSFRPLELSIYVPNGIHLSPLPDFSGEWDEKTVDLAMPKEAHVRSESAASNYSNFRIPRKALPSSSSIDETSILNLRRSIDMARRSTSIDLDTLSSTPGPTIRRSHTSTTLPSSPSRPSLSLFPPATTLPRVHSPARARSNTEPARRTSFRRPTPPTIDDEIRELNTIVEERRSARIASSARTSTSDLSRSPDTVIPAIAPSMKVHARTETLSDIGSAFSVSYNKAVTSSSSLLPSRPVSSTRPVLRLTLDPAAGDCTTPAEKTPRARLSAWLRRSLPSSPAHPNPPVPFYQCAPIPSQRPATATTTASQAQALTSNPPTPPFSSEWHRRTRTSFSTITTTTLEEVEEPASPSYTEATGLGGVVWGKEGVSVGDGGRLREVGIGIRKEGDMPPRYQVVDPHPNSPRGVIGVAF